MNDWEWGVFVSSFLLGISLKKLHILTSLHFAHHQNRWHPRSPLWRSSGNVVWAAKLATIQQYHLHDRRFAASIRTK